MWAVERVGRRRVLRRCVMGARVVEMYVRDMVARRGVVLVGGDAE